MHTFGATVCQTNLGEASALLRHMVKAIFATHLANLSHNDIKLENWMFVDTVEGACLKLIDFGLSLRGGSEILDPKHPTSVGARIAVGCPQVRF